MIRILRHYGQEYEIWRGGTRGFDDILYFYSHGYAYNFLSRFLPGSMNARKLRSLYAETHAIHNTSGLTERDLLHSLAWDLVSGVVTVRVRPRRPHEPPWVPVGFTPPPPLPPPSSSAAPPPSPAQDRAPVASAPPPAPETDVDAEAQAATLKAAAETGVPFCEKCERAKREAQQKAAAP